MFNIELSVVIMAVDSKTNMFNVFEKCKILQLMNRSQAHLLTTPKPFITVLLYFIHMLCSYVEAL